MWTKYWMKNIPTRLGDPPKQIRGKGPRVHGTMSRPLSGLIHMYLYCKVGIVHNYPTKGR